MNKYMPYVLIFSLVLLGVFSYLYYKDYEKGKIDDEEEIVFEEKIEEREELIIKPEVIERGGENQLEGFLIENKIEEDGYIILQVNTNGFFVNHPELQKRFKIQVDKNRKVVLRDDGALHHNLSLDEATEIINYNDLKPYDRISVNVNRKINQIFEDDIDFIATRELIKLVQRDYLYDGSLIEE